MIKKLWLPFLFVLSLIMAFFLFFKEEGPKSWEQANGPYGGYIHCLAVKDQKIFAGNREMVYFIHSDQGNSWKAVNSGLTNSYIHSLVISGPNLFAGTSSGIFVSPVEKMDWKSIDSQWEDLMVYSLVADEGYLCAGTSRGVLYSEDNGLKWNKAGKGLTSGDVKAIVVNGGEMLLVQRRGGSIAPRIMGPAGLRLIPALQLAGQCTFRK